MSGRVRRLADRLRPLAADPGRRQFCRGIGHGWAPLESTVASARKCAVQTRKPDPRIYHLTLERVDLPPEACIFIDDMEINCKAAEEIGIHAVHFRETAQARAEVHALLKSN